MNPTIIFCRKVNAESLAVSTGFFLMTILSIKEGLAELAQGKTIIVTDEYILNMGWRAPDGTNLVFTEDFPSKGSATRIQAEGRVRSVPPTPHHMRLKLDERIRNQRIALRNNWMITEQRAHFILRSSRTLTRTALRLLDKHNIPKEENGCGISLFNRIRLLDEKLFRLEQLEMDHHDKN